MYGLDTKTRHRRLSARSLDGASPRFVWVWHWFFYGLAALSICYLLPANREFGICSYRRFGMLIGIWHTGRALPQLQPRLSVTLFAGTGHRHR